MASLSLTSKLILQTAAISLLSGGGIALGVVRIMAELDAQEGPGAGPAVARLEEKVETVQRKRASHYSWSKVGVGGFFYDRESLQTGDSGRAEVSLLKSEGVAKLEIDENSLILFDENAERSFRLLEGSLILRDQSGESKITVSENGREKLVKLTAKLNAPAPGEELFTRKNQKRELTFRWTQPAGLKADLRVEVSTDAKFSNATLAPVTSDTAGQAKLKIAAGGYYWRVLDGKNAISREGKFLVTEVSPFQLAIRTTANENATEVRWKAPAEMQPRKLGEHQIEISANETFRSLATSDSAFFGDGSLILRGLKSGTYYGRIRSRYGDLEVDSDTVTFRVMSSLGRLARIAAEGAKEQMGAPVRDSTPDNSSSRAPAAFAKNSGIDPRQPLAEGIDTAAEIDNGTAAPPAILAHNQNPLLISLSSRQYDAKSLQLTWNNTGNPPPDAWQVWCVSAEGTLVKQLSPSTQISGIEETFTTLVANAALATCQYLLVQSSDGSLQSNILHYALAPSPPQPPLITGAYPILAWRFVCQNNCPGKLLSTWNPQRTSWPSGPFQPLLGELFRIVGTGPSTSDFGTNAMYKIVNTDALEFPRGQPVIRVTIDMITIFWNSTQLVDGYKVSIYRGNHQAQTAYQVSGTLQSIFIHYKFDGIDPNFFVSITAVTGTGAGAIESVPAVFPFCVNHGLSMAQIASEAAKNPSVQINRINGLYAGSSSYYDLNGDGSVDILDMINAGRFTLPCNQP